MFKECVLCKGSRNLCKLGFCPLLKKLSEYLPKLKFNTNEVFGAAPPSIFVGRYNYPNVFVGPMISEIGTEISNPESWYGLELSEIAAKSTSLLRPSKNINVHKANDKFIELTQEIAMSDKSIDVEAQLSKRYQSPKPSLDFFIHPVGPRLEVQKLLVAQNIPIPRKVDAVVSDTDLSAKEAIYELYKNNIPISHIYRVLSAGVLGIERYRKLVPTRWAITATDDIIGKIMIENIKNYSIIENILMFKNSYLGNTFYIYLLPRIWSFEMIENWNKGAVFADDNIGTGDFEGYSGRKTYASTVTGAYYAARLAVLEYLEHIKRQASVLIYRIISQEYIIPLGVWLIRETVRNALKTKARKFITLKELIMEKNIPYSLINKSKLLKIMNVQRTLDKYI